MLRPVKVEMLLRYPAVYMYRGLITDKEAEGLKDLARPKVRGPGPTTGRYSDEDGDDEDGGDADNDRWNNAVDDNGDGDDDDGDDG